MKSDEREVVYFHQRDRQVITEGDLETNYDLVKEVVYASLESSLMPGARTEVPLLADFEARFFWASPQNTIFVQKEA